MKHRTIAAWCLSAALLAMPACSLLMDVSEVDEGCPPGQKWCEGSCVANNNAAYGCKPDECLPCERSNAVPRCDGEECVVDACLFGFGCPGEHGCDVNVTIDRNHCGRCGNVCHAPCRNAECVVSECDPGFLDCDPSTDGCETDLRLTKTCEES